MRKINSIYIHHSASEFGNAKLIEEWHKQRGFKKIGYHFVVLNGYRTSGDFKEKKVHEELIGKIEIGRAVKEVGAHVQGHNQGSIGICLVHDNNGVYSRKQLESYRILAAGLAKYYNIDVKNIKGHYEVDKKKPLCPSLDMDKERELIAEKIPHISHKILDMHEKDYNLK
jgi:hypothetical protein